MNGITLNQKDLMGGVAARSVERGPTRPPLERYVQAAGNDGAVSKTQEQHSRLVERTEKAVAKLARETDLDFEIDREDGHVIVRVFDKESGKLLREIPPDELNLFARQTVGQSGRLIRTSV